MKTTVHSGLKALPLFGLAAAVTAVGINADAATVSADFNDLNSNQALNGDAGGSGFSGNWGGSGNPQVISGDLTYANYGITQTGNTRKISDFGGSGSARQSDRALSSALTGTVWFSFLVQTNDEGTFTNGQGETSDIVSSAGLTFNLSGFNPTGAAPVSVLLVDDKVNVRVDGGAATEATGTYAQGQTHLVLGQMILTGGNDTLNLWIDPDLSGPGALPVANYTNSSLDFATSIDRVAVAVWSDAGGGTPASAFVDAVYLSDDASTGFADVTGVPEPGSLALLGLGGLCMLRRRRQG